MNPSDSHSLLTSAAERALHFSRCMEWFSHQLSSSQDFGQVFTLLVSALAEAETWTGSGCGGVRRQVHLLGVGKSGGVAQLVASMLTSVGVLSRYLHPGEAFHGDLGAVCENDTVLCLSRDGGTAELLQIIPKLRERSCRVFALTSRPESPLAKASDYTLPLPPFDEACPLQQAPITSTVSALALCQLLVAASVEHRAFAVTSYARNHPGGSIGRRIYVKVADIMVQGDALPVARPGMTFSECVAALTRYAMSALMVVEQGILLGVISEKDMRVAMEKWQADVFSKCATDLMNPTPITIQSGMLAVDAHKIMMDRPRPLNFLPVIDGEGKALGLLRIHDLVSAGIA